MREAPRIETCLIYQESAPNFLVTGYLVETIMMGMDLFLAGIVMIMMSLENIIGELCIIMMTLICILMSI